MLQDKFSTLEVDRAATAAKLESLLRERPKTAASKRAAVCVIVFLSVTELGREPTVLDVI